MMGGLGNQMFQYAAARALAARSGSELVLDPWSGFARDIVYKRRYELGSFAVRGRHATKAEGLPFWFERLKLKYSGHQPPPVSERPWGTLLWEPEQRVYPEVLSMTAHRSIWSHGHWQSERYFDEMRAEVGEELTPPEPLDSQFLEMGSQIDSTQAVAIGVRLFEEMPGATKDVVGGLTGEAFYRTAAERLAGSLSHPVFFLFCSTLQPAVRALKLPGPVHYVTGDAGFSSAVDSLWLLSRCRNHIVSNSSFFWWGAWLAERRHADARVLVSNRFPNPGTVPSRWESLTL